MNDCVKVQLKGSAKNENLPVYGEILIDATWTAVSGYNTVDFMPGPGTNSDKLDDDLTIEIISGGNIDGETSKTLTKGTVANRYAAITITKTDGAERLKMRITNKYTLNGFGFTNGRLINFSNLKMEDVAYSINVNRFTFSEWANSYNLNINLTDFFEKQLENGRTKDLSAYCYINIPYSVYEGESVIATSSNSVYFVLNNDRTMYELHLGSVSGTLMAKRQLVNGEWVSLPTTE